jgi:hypothetical protein
MPLYGVGYPLLAPDGVQTAPTYSFGTATGTGIYNVAGALAVTVTGTQRVVFGAGSTTFTGTNPFITIQDVVLIRDGAANILALRNSTTAQTFRVYNTYTDSSNYERAVFDWSTVANRLTIGPAAAGSGTLRSIGFTSHTLWNTDNTYDIGASSANRPRTIYVASNGFFGQNLQALLTVAAYASTAIPAGGTAGKGFLLSSATNFGVFFGSGAPTLSAAKGSLYLRSDGTGVADRMYVNTDGSTTWTAVATAG